MRVLYANHRFLNKLVRKLRATHGNTNPLRASERFLKPSRPTALCVAEDVQRVLQRTVGDGALVCDDTRLLFGWIRGAFPSRLGQCWHVHLADDDHACQQAADMVALYGFLRVCYSPLRLALAFCAHYRYAIEPRIGSVATHV